MTSIDCLGRLTRTVDPTAEPVSLEELLSQIRTSDPADDLNVAHYGRRARQALEDAYRIAFITQTWTWKLDYWTDYELAIPLVPVTSVSSIAYVDEAGTAQTWSSSLYQVATSYRQRARIMPAYGESWPSLRTETYNAVTVTFAAGWATAAAVPLPLKQAVLMYAAFLFANRGDVEAKHDMPSAVSCLMGSYGLEMYV